MESCSSIDAGNPESTEFTLLCPAMPIGMLSGFIDVMLGNGQHFTSTTPISFR
jgi:hypothetical protein